MANSFGIEKSSQDDIAVLKLEGYLDAHTAPEFEAAIENEMESGQQKIVVDCEKLTYISSAGLGVFMGFIEEIRERDGDIKICALNAKVNEVFELLGFHQLFHIEATLPEALQRFKDSPVWEG